MAAAVHPKSLWNSENILQNRFHSLQPQSVPNRVNRLCSLYSLWISVALVLAVRLGAHVARDLVEEPRFALLLQYPVARHELVDGRQGRRHQVQQDQALKEHELCTGWSIWSWTTIC